MPHRPLRVAALVLAAIWHCDGAWTTLGANSFRTNQVSISLPGDTTGVHADTYSFSQVSGNITLPPLTLSQQGQYYTVVADDACNVNVLDITPSVVASWNGCTDVDGSLVAISFDDAGGILVAVTSNGAIYALNGQVASGSFGSMLWTTPAYVYDTVALSPLMVSNGIWVVGSRALYQLNIVTNGTIVGTYNTTCNGQPDPVTAPLAMMTATIGSYSIAGVTSSGCAFSIRSDGALNWNATQPSALNGTASPSAPVTISPVSDSSLQQVYFATNDGNVCCYGFDGAAPCSLWPDVCINVGPAAPLVQGLALGPANTAFHHGQLFMLDTAGNLYVVMTTVGMYVSSGSSLSIGTVYTAPVIVPNALGDDLNVMLVANADGVLLAIYVGDAPLPDDDNSSDDDSEGNDGIAWQAVLVSNVSATAPVTMGLSAPPGFAKRAGTPVQALGSSKASSMGGSAGGSSSAGAGVVLRARSVGAAAAAVGVIPSSSPQPSSTPSQADGTSGAGSPVMDDIIGAFKFAVSSWFPSPFSRMLGIPSANTGGTMGRALQRVQPEELKDVAVSVPAIAVRDDGRIIVPLNGGKVCIVGPQHSPKGDASYVIIIIVVTVVVVVFGGAVIVIVWCAVRNRRRAEAAMYGSSGDQGGYYNDEGDALSLIVMRQDQNGYMPPGGDDGHHDHHHHDHDHHHEHHHGSINHSDSYNVGSSSDTGGGGGGYDGGSDSHHHHHNE